jgi:hypothetical protein
MFLFNLFFAALPLNLPILAKFFLPKPIIIKSAVVAEQILNLSIDHEKTFYFITQLFIGCDDFSTRQVGFEAVR